MMMMKRYINEIRVDQAEKKKMVFLISIETQKYLRIILSRDFHARSIQKVTIYIFKDIIDKIQSYFV